jgi:cAMP-dependent protein kinase regulator
MPGARPARGRANASAGIFAIPLSDEVSEDQPLHLSLVGDLELAGAGASNIGLDPHGNVISGEFERPKEISAEGTEDQLIAAVEEEVRAAQKANDVLAGIPLFRDLSPKTFSDLLLHARLVELKKGQELFKQGDAGDAFYVIAEGTVGVIDEGPPRRGIAKLGDGQFFGEIALVTDQPRTATIAALTDTQLIAVDRDVVRKLVVSDPNFLTILLRFLRDRLVDRLLSTNPLFTVLSPRDRESIRLRFRFLEAEAGSVLLQQGKLCDGLLILLAGKAEVVREHGDKLVQLAMLKTGDLCGEMSLVTQSPAIGSLRAITKCLMLELPAPAFLTIVNARPEAMAFIQQVIDQRRAQAKAILAGSAQYAEGRLRGL